MASSPKAAAYKKEINTLVKHYGKVAVDPKQVKICEESGLDSLLNLANMPQVKVQSLATDVINSLEEENGEVDVTNAEGMRQLVRLTAFPEEDVQREAVWALAILASHQSCRVRIEQEVGWHNFRKYASSPVPEIQAGTAILLGNLALERKIQEIMMEKGTPLLLEMLHSTENPKVVRAVVTALSNVSMIEDHGAKELWSNQGLELIVPYIKQDEDPQLQIGALNTIANICNHDDPDLKQKVVELGGLGCLVPLLDNADEMVVKLAAMTIANMGSEPSHRQVLRDLAVVEPLVRLLDSRDDEVQLGVSMAINSLAHNEDIRKEFRDRQAAEALVELIRLTKDKDIVKEAKAALKQISPEDYNTLVGQRGSDTSDSETYSESASETETHSSQYESEDSRRDDKKGKKVRRNSRSKQDDKSGDESRSETERSKTDRSERSYNSESDPKSDPSASDGTGEDAEERLHKRNRASSAAEAAVKRNAELQQQEDEERARQEEEDDRNRLDEVDVEPELNEEIHRRLEETRSKRPEATDESDLGNKRYSGISTGSKRRSINRSGGSPAPTKPREEEVRTKRVEYDERHQEVQDTKRAGTPVDNSRGLRESVRNRGSPRPVSPRRRDSVGSDRRRRDRREEDRKTRSKGKQPVRETSEESSQYGSDSDDYSESSGSDIDPPSQRGRSEPMYTPSLDPSANPASELANLLRLARNKQGVSKNWLRDIERFSGLSPKSQLHRGEDVIPILVYIIYFYPDVNYPVIVSLALYILALLGRYHVSNQVAIRKAKGGEQIQRLLSSNVPRVQRNAALSLGSYSLNNPPIQAESARGIPQLIQILDAPETPPVTRKAVAACLVSLADNNKANQEMMVQHNCLEVAIKLGDTHQDFIRPVLHLVAAIVSRNANCQNAIYSDHPNYVVSLITMLSVQPRPMHPFVTNTLVELVRKNARIQLMLFHNGAIAKLVPLLSDSADQTIVNVLFVLYTMAKNRKNGSRVRDALRDGHVPGLLRNFSVSPDKEIADIASSLARLL